MPDAFIVSEKECIKKSGRIDYRKLITLLVKRGIINYVTVKGKRVYGRTYLEKASIRKAYHEKKPRRRRF